MKKNVRQNGILVTEKRMRVQKEPAFFWGINYLLDCLLIWMCLYGALFGFCQVMKITAFLNTTLVALVLVVFIVRLLCDKRWKEKYVFLILLVLYGVVLFLYHTELYYGLMYWADRFFVFYNSYFSQNLAVSTDYVGVEAYSSTILLLFAGSVMTVFLAESQRMTRAGLTGMILPFCIFILPFIVGQIPEPKYVILFLGGMLPLAFSVESRSARMRSQIKMIGAFSFLVVMLLCVWVFPESKYNEKYQELQETKTDIQESFKNKQYDDLIYYFGDFEWLPFVTSGSGGVNNGTLGNRDEIVYDNKTDFDLYIQKLENEDNQLPLNNDLYLRSYVGTNYKNKQWMDMTSSEKKKYNKLTDKSEMNLEKLPEKLYDIFYNIFDTSSFAKNQVDFKYKITKRRVTRKHSLLSYGTTGNLYVKDQMFQTSGTKHKKTFWDEANALYLTPETLDGQPSIWSMALSSFAQILQEEQDGTFGDTYKGRMDDFNKTEQQYRKFVYSTYTEVGEDIAPQLCSAVDNIDRLDNYQSYSLINNNYTENIWELIDQCYRLLLTNTRYTLKPGKTPQGKDLIDYFLYENKKGYCTYYATTACIFFRLCGIPSRYIEGYHVHTYDLTSMEPRTIIGKDGNKTTEKYYPVDVKDSNAHAWIEIYINGYGWIPLDFTPSDPGDASTIEDNTKEEAGGDETDQQKNPAAPSPSVSPSPSPSVSADVPAASEDVQEIYGTASEAFRLSHAVKAVLMVVLIILLIAAVYVRYHILLKRQNRLKTNKNLNVRVKYCYKKIKNQLYVKCSISNQQELKENKTDICEKLSELSEEELQNLIAIVEKASFGSGQISDYECTKAKIFAENVDKLFYENMPRWKQLYYKVWKLY